jgi:hypothetical protein
MAANFVKLFLAAMMLALAGYCLFGFLATYEPGVHHPFVWRIAYAVAGAGSLLASLWFVWATWLHGRAQ